MNTIKMQEWAKKLNLSVEKIARIVKTFGIAAERVLQSALDQRLEKDLKPVYGDSAPGMIQRVSERGKSAEGAAYGVKYKASAAPHRSQPTRGQVIAALARRFNVSEAALKAAVLQHGSIAGGIEAIKAQHTTVESLVFPAQKRVNPMSPGAFWGYQTSARPAPAQPQQSTIPTAQKGKHPMSPAAFWGYDTVESTMSLAEAKMQTGVKNRDNSTVETLIFGKKRG